MAHTSVLSTKFLTTGRLALLATSLFFKAASVNGANFDSAFDEPNNSHQHQISLSSEDLLESSIDHLSRLQKIYEFDKDILLENTSLGGLDFSHLNLSGALPLLRFYSEDGETRSSAFESEIKRPLLNIVSSAVHASSKFPQILKYLEAPSVYLSTLVSEAVKDVFQHPTQGLTALREALISLKANKKLTAIEKGNLRLFEKLAGFFYDKQALDYLVNLNKKTLSPALNMAQVADRITLLRVIQVHGETFKLMRPSTLNLGIYLPSDGVLEGLRDILSHLSGQKIKNLFSSEADILQLFTNLYNDIQHLNTVLQTMKTQYEDGHNQPTPSSLWVHIKFLSDIRNAPSAGYPYEGIQRLLELLTPHHAPYPADTDELKGFSEKMIPFSRDPQEIESYFKRRNEIYQILNRKGKTLGELKDFHSSLGRVHLSVDLHQAQEIFDRLRAYQTEIGELFKARNKDEAEKKKEEQELWRDQTINQFMGIDDQVHTVFTSAREIMNETKGKQIKLFESFTEIAKKPCRGFGNISAKYADFCDQVGEIDSHLTAHTFKWDRDPEPGLEPIFHILHQTGLISKVEKDNLRKTRLQELLDVIDNIEVFLGFRTSLEFETKKEELKGYIEEKAKLMANKLRSLDPRQDLKALQKIQQDFYKLSENFLNIATEPQLETLKTYTKYHIHTFLDGYGKIQSGDTDYEQEFLNTNRMERKNQLQGFIKKEQIKKDHRFHKPNRVEQQLKRQLESGNPSHIQAGEFLISSFYELSKEVNDYPELWFLKDTPQIRNHFFHTNPFKSDPLIVKGKGLEAGIYINSDTGTLAKELSILLVNIKYLLSETFKTI